MEFHERLELNIGKAILLATPMAACDRATSSSPSLRVACLDLLLLNRSAGSTVGVQAVPGCAVRTECFGRLVLTAPTTMLGPVKL
jgi:hypothetical protein